MDFILFANSPELKFEKVLKNMEEQIKFTLTGHFKENNNMHKILYFSGTGNTAFIAGQIEAGLRGKGFDVSIERMEKSNPGDCLNVESLYFGFPIYACDMPELVRDYLKALPEGMGIPVRIFSTMAFFSGKAMNHAAVLFAEKGYSITSSYERKMPGSDGLALLKKEGRTAKKLLANFNSDMSDLYEWMEDDDEIGKLKRTIDPAGKLVGWMMKMAERGMKKKYRADEHCISCGLCSRICPVSNITMIEKKPQFGGQCMLCMRCIHQCPVEAIQIGNATVDKFRYKGPTGQFSLR